MERLPFALLRRLYQKQVKVDLEDLALAAIELKKCDACDLRFYVPAISGDERFYESLQKFDWYYAVEKPEYEFAAQYISSEDRVLEVGAGRGAFSAKIKPKSYEGLELSEAAAQQARQRGIQVHKRSLEEHSVDHENGYDVVCSFQVLEHIPETRSFIELSLRCLKRGGRLICSVPWEDGFTGRQSNNVLNMPPHHATRWTDKALGHVAELFDLQVIAIGYDVLSDLHIRGYSTTLIENSFNGVLGRRHRTLDGVLSSILIKAPVRFLSLFLETGLQDRALRPAGHSVTMVYQKP
jgi:SAM-dependent methyltransferase